jgi:general secretion pathway protein D
MEINLEQSDVASTKLGSLDNIPVFKKKTAKTTLSIMEGQTIVIGGLIEDKKEAGTSGVPFLSRLPIIGALFGYQTRDINKTETVLLLTPHVITDLEESNQVTREFREKVQGLKKELEKTKEKEKK